MEILTIYLSPMIVRSMGTHHSVKTVASFHQAIEVLEQEDFHCIVEDVRHSDRFDEDLANLLAHTTIGTHIIALGVPGVPLDVDYWRNQGVSLLTDLDDASLAVKVQQLINP